MWRIRSGLFVVSVIALSVSFFYLIPAHTYATTGINQELSFEGKIVTSAGINITDGSYNMEFQIYTGCTNNTGSGCTEVWQENWLVTNSQPVVFTSGTFQVNLGTVNPFGTSVPWNTYPLYLSVEIGNTTNSGANSCVGPTNFAANCGGDGVMSPYILLTSTPYALNSNELGGLTAGQFGQLATSQTWTGANIFQTASNSAAALQIDNAAGSQLLNVNNTSTNNLLTYPSFEDGSFTNSASGWVGVSPGTIAPNTTAADSYDGLDSLDLMTTTSNGGAQTDAFTGTVAAGTYYVSFYVMPGSAMNASAFTVTLNDGSNHTCSPASQTLSTTSFIRVSCSTTTSSNLSSLTIAQNDSTARSNIYISDVQLQTTGVTNYQLGTLQLAGTTVTSPAIFENSANSTTAFQVQNASGNPVFDVDTTNQQVVLGKASSTNGTVVFNTSGAGAITLDAASTTTGYTLTLPTTGPSTSQCLQSGASTPALLVFASCATGGSGVTTVGALNGGSANANAATISGTTIYLQSASGTEPGVLSTTTQTIDGAKTFNSATTVATATNSVNALQVQTSSGSDLLNVNTSSSVVNFNQLSAPGTVTTSLAPAAPTSIVVTGSTASSTTYTYEILGVDANGAVTYSSPTTTKSSSDAATLSATNYNTVNWASTGATTYEVYRTAYSTNSTNVGLIGTTTGTSFADTGQTASGSIPTSSAAGLTNGTTYYYSVTALDGLGGQTTGYAAVVNDTATTATNDAITISWPADPGARAYNVYYNVGSTLTAGTAYDYFTVYTNNFTMTTTSSNSQTLPTTDTAYFSTLASSGTSQLTVGNTAGSASTEQLDVAGNVPSAAVGSVALNGPFYSYIQGNYVYTANNAGGTMAIDDVSNPTDPVQLSTIATGTSPWDVYVQGNYAYVSNNGSGTVSVINVSNPSAPVIIATISVAGPTTLQVQGSYLYVLGTSAELSIYNISNPDSPVLVGATSGGSNPYGLSVQGNYAYVADHASGFIYIYNISNPNAPTLVSSVSDGPSPGPYSITVSGAYAYVANNGNDTFTIFNISNPATPVMVSSTSAGGAYPTSVFIQGNYAYLGGLLNNTVPIYNISNPYAPDLVGSIATGADPGDALVQGNYLYAIDSSGSLLQIFNVGGAYIQQLQAGGTETGTLQVDNNANISGSESVSGGLNVGGSLTVSTNIGTDGSASFGGPVTAEDTALIQDPGASTNSLTVDNNLGIPVLVAGSNNDIINGDFEAPADTTGWAATGTGASIALNTSLAYAYSGVNSLAITTGTTANVGAQVTGFNTTLSAGIYVLSFEAEAATGFSTLEANVGGTACTLNSNTVSATAWTAYSCTVTTSGTSTYVDIESSGTTAVTFYVDAVSLSSSSVDLVSNPGFENGTSGWSAGTGSGITLNQVRNYAYEGQASLYVTTGSTANEGAKDSTYISSLGAATYTLSFFVEGTTAFTTMEASLGSGTCTLYSGGVTSNTVSISGFKQFYCTDTTTGAPAIQIGSSGTAAVDFYLDDVQLVTGSSALPYNIGQIQLRGIVDNPVIFQGTSNSTQALQVANAVGLDLLNVDTLDGVVQVGSQVSNGNTILFGLNNYNTFADPSTTCSSTVDLGAMYYNGNADANSIRACINGVWEDLASTDVLNAILFGVVPDSGTTAQQGDLAGATGLTDGPCKVFVGSTSTSYISWNACEAWSGGRKVYVAAGSNLLTTNSTAGDFQHFCLTNTGSDQPALSTAAAETANLSTDSMPSAAGPLLCLADIKFSGANNTITTIYDTRTFTTTQKEFATDITNGAVLGSVVVVGSTTPGSVTPATTLQAGGIQGVVVASTGSASTSTVNVMIATSGPAWVKSITESGGNSVGNTLQTTATTGYAGAFATATATNVYSVLGMARTAWTGATTCATSSNACAGSVLTFVAPR